MQSDNGRGVLLFGGSFDPLHHGHLIISRAVAERIGAARVVLIPSAVPPHKQNKRLAPPADRLEMCRRAVAGDSLFEVSDWELGQPGPNYTLLTVQHFRKQAAAEATLYWLIGLDGLNELDTWHRIAELVEACTIVTAVRPGHAAPDLKRLSPLLRPEQIGRLSQFVIDTPLLDISSTQVRERVARGQSIRYLTPEPVREWIETRGLYRTPQ
jgi:nicotinate-nucleotide adenylyltransferase